MGTQQQGTQPGTYSITVTGTSGTLSHQALYRDPDREPVADTAVRARWSRRDHQS